MKVKIFDENHEKDLEESVNNFIEDKEIIDIKYQVAISDFSEDQVYCFSALIMYKWNSIKKYVNLVILLILIRFFLYNSKVNEVMIC